MVKLPTFGIVMPSYNTARHIGEAISSVLEQEHSGVDFLVMDGGSTDQTLEVLRSFGERIRWVSQKDAGQSDAIRRGFDQTSGEILGWLNADDTLAPGALRRVAEFFAAHPEIAMVYGDANYIDAAGAPIGPCAHIEPFNTARLFHYSDFIVQPAAFFRRSAYRAVGGLDPTLHFAMDYDLWIKLARQFEIAYLPGHLANYRWLTDNKTAVGGFRRLDEITAMAARHGFPQPAYIRLERVNLLLRDALTSLSSGKILSGFGSCARAAGTLLTSPRAVWSLFQPRTWRIIWTGQVLRARAARVAVQPEGADPIAR